ncbi:MAG: hypothetical protein IPM82_10970 [Saprospiraceae bacterium]|nr:hypothetical protein [Saprospiraceae bacterium]
MPSFPFFAQQKTYCNPTNIDYGYTPYESFAAWGKHRATADPVIVNYKGDFYLFSTNQGGYWHSPDMLNWNFHKRPFLRPWNSETKDDLCAPASASSATRWWCSAAPTPPTSRFGAAPTPRETSGSCWWTASKSAAGIRLFSPTTTGGFICTTAAATATPCTASNWTARRFSPKAPHAHVPP